MNVSNTALNTTISNDFGVKVSTIEHLMGALFGLGIDNALIEIDNEEVPILDGSAKFFINEILSAGLESSNKPIKIIKINQKVEFKNGEKFISIEPSNHLKLLKIIYILYMNIFLTI
jgi:UDP-3-O-[3-hydroxymyristoyl] N-acetylglucosamine deacetylase